MRLNAAVSPAVTGLKRSNPSVADDSMAVDPTDSGPVGGGVRWTNTVVLGKTPVEFMDFAYGEGKWTYSMLLNISASKTHFQQLFAVTGMALKTNLVEVAAADSPVHLVFFAPPPTVVDGETAEKWVLEQLHVPCGDDVDVAQAQLVNRTVLVTLADPYALWSMLKALVEGVGAPSYRHVGPSWTELNKTQALKVATPLSTLRKSLD
jgi:hypothetical protein